MGEKVQAKTHRARALPFFFFFSNSKQKCSHYQYGMGSMCNFYNQELHKHTICTAKKSNIGVPYSLQCQ